MALRPVAGGMTTRALAVIAVALGLAGAAAPARADDAEVASLCRAFRDRTGVALVFDRAALPGRRWFPIMPALASAQAADAARLLLAEARRYPAGWLGRTGLTRIGVFAGLAARRDDGYRWWDDALGGYRYSGKWNGKDAIALGYYSDWQLILTFHHELHHAIDTASGFGRDDVRMGPLATKAQQRDIEAGIARLAAATDEGYGGTGAIAPLGVAPGVGCFVGPVVRTTADGAGCAVMHDHEVFGPVVTVAAYDGDASAAARLVARGHGSLATSCYSDDKDWLARFVPAAGAVSGRVYIGSEKMASLSPGPGTALPQLQHGGPGRAGDGAELGGLRGLALYQQRVALQGDATILKGLA